MQTAVSGLPRGRTRRETAVGSSRVSPAAARRPAPGRLARPGPPRPPLATRLDGRTFRSSACTMHKVYFSRAPDYILYHARRPMMPPAHTGARPRRLLAALVTWHTSTACSERSSLPTSGRTAAERVRAVTVLFPCAAAALHRRWLRDLTEIGSGIGYVIRSAVSLTRGGTCSATDRPEASQAALEYLWDADVRHQQA